MDARNIYCLVASTPYTRVHVAERIEARRGRVGRRRTETVPKRMMVHGRCRTKGESVGFGGERKRTKSREASLASSSPFISLCAAG